jgi:hypothetical protein
MELPVLYLGLMTVAGLCGWGSFAVWHKGHRPAVWVALALIVGLVALLAYAASVATGHYLAGLGEMLAALALAMGPGAGIVLGLITANWKRVGLALSGLYAFGLAVLMVGVG